MEMAVFSAIKEKYDNIDKRIRNQNLIRILQTLFCGQRL